MVDYIICPNEHTTCHGTRKNTAI